MKDALNIAIAGATGYVGIELIKILSKHSKAKILYLCATKSIGKKIYNFDKKIHKKNLPKISKIKNIDWNKINILFTALPNGEAQKIAKIMPQHIKLIDLSADFRLKDFRLYRKWYGIKHKCKELLNKSLYAITEFSRNDLDKHRIISCPGCYPTSIQIPLIPLIQKKMINVKNIIIDSKSGYSGAGRNLKGKFKFINIFDSVSAYGVASHKHLPEIDQELSKISKKKIKVFFTPHLIPMFRGILSTIYLETSGKNNAIKIYKFLKKYHRKNFFVKISRFNTPIRTGEVMNTNYCNISVCKSRQKNKIIIISAIDNLIKGASGQAVQNMNVAFKLKETLGLI
jgi:N-acetyl-gamma-glutamyl-phosphate reductase